MFCMAAWLIGFLNRHFASHMVLNLSHGACSARVKCAFCCLQVIIRANHAKASAATPFTIAYGTSPNNTNPNVLLGSLLVTQVPLTNLTLPNAPSWALVINRQGPAECFFVNNGDDSLIKAC